MRPYSPDTGIGRTVAGHDVHHKTADLSRRSARSIAKVLRHSARQQARQQANTGLQEWCEDES